jgi:hypothetical protein
MSDFQADYYYVQTLGSTADNTTLLASSSSSYEEYDATFFLVLALFIVQLLVAIYLVCHMRALRRQVCSVLVM